MVRPLKPTLSGRELSKAELKVIEQYLRTTRTISGISDEMLALIAQLWPEHLVKIKGRKTINN